MGGGRNKDMNKMMKQVQKMQQDMQQAQEELAKETVTGSAGGGAVKVTATGTVEITGVEIDPGVVDPEDVEMLQDLVLAATKDAMANAQELSSQRMESITGGLGDMGIPGL